MFCILCAGGEFSGRAGQGDCQNCETGKYRPSGGEFNLCVDCPLGWSSGEGFRDCEHCPDGRYSPQNRTVCEGCPSGYYSDREVTTTEKCTACAAGQYSTPQQKSVTFAKKERIQTKLQANSAPVVKQMANIPMKWAPLAANNARPMNLFRKVMHVANW